ncbi:amidohydrolase family protein [Streptomyces formicae]|uniref:Xaa-Pro dipeptidase n=1 Tax=Streptomyces formicae TaxID=1616117 RepID=A0A291Q3Z7_9ACTN|nr:amidohydrolase family protein [Streptomyces formicae]ATL26227.1 Xaa-Pro dipeptidase [Streptomyces formicae]
MTERIYAAGLLLHGPADRAALADGAVRVAGATITDVGPRDEVIARAAPGTEVTHFPDGTLLPGLIDAHVHLAFDDHSDDPVGALRASGAPALALNAAGAARRLLDGGVTTVRDLGDRDGVGVALRDSVRDGVLPGPRILAAGAPVTVRGGHCWFLGGEATGADGVREVVRANLAAGADLIKVMATGGTLTPGGPAPAEPQFTVAELTVAVREAHAAGARVAAHVHGVAGVEVALAAGVDTLEHCSFISADGPAAGPEHRPDVIDRIAEAGTFVCPTYSGSLDRAAASIGIDRLRPWLDVVLRQHERGVRLIAGTDAGIPGAGFDEYAVGLSWFVRAGLPAPTVVEMATSRAAEALGLADVTGTLAPGRDADLLVVTGDPRQDVAVLGAPGLVVARGREHLPGSARTAPASGIRSTV